MDLTTLVSVIPPYLGVLDDLHNRFFTRLLTVSDVITDLQCTCAARNLVKLREEFSLQDTVKKRVRFLWTSGTDREPVILELTGTDELDRPHWDRAFSQDLELLVDHRFLDNVDV